MRLEMALPAGAAHLSSSPCRRICCSCCMSLSSTQEDYYRLSKSIIWHIEMHRLVTFNYLPPCHCHAISICPAFCDMTADIMDHLTLLSKIFDSYLRESMLPQIKIHPSNVVCRARIHGMAFRFVVGSQDKGDLEPSDLGRTKKIPRYQPAKVWTWR